MTNLSIQTHNEATQLKAEIATLKLQLQQAKQEISWFKEQFKLNRKRQFGKQTEATEAVQHVLFDEHECDEVIETVTPIDDDNEQVTRSRPKRKATGRNIDTSKLPRTQQIHDLPDAEKVCACGCEKKCIGEDTSEQIDYIPAKVTVIEHITPKYACEQCDTLSMAKKPEKALPKCMATDSFIADVVIKKFEHHLPLYRQSKILLGEDIDIPDNTLGNWVSGAATALMPLRDALLEQIPTLHELQVDETPVKLLKPDKKGYMWAYHSLTENNRFVLFDYHLSRSASIVEARLQGFKGLMQTDGYSAYNSLRKQPDITSLGCFDHARRKFVDAIKIGGDNKAGIAGKLLKKINHLYKIERSIKAASIEKRLRARQTQSASCLAEIKALATDASVPPKSALGSAITYLLNQWPYLYEYINHPKMPISNILIENHIRPLALGKKNWLFVGNVKSGNQAALLYSLIQTCKINKINPRQYLIYALSQAPAMRRKEIAPRSLLPQFIDASLL